MIRSFGKVTVAALAAILTVGGIHAAEQNVRQLNRAMAMAGDKLWTGNGHGAILWDVNDFTSEFFDKRNKLESNDIRSIIIAGDGAAWIAAYGGGISRLKGDKWTSFTPENGLHSAKVTCLLDGGDGTVWAGSDDGLMHCKDDVWTLYTEKQGMMTNVVTSLARDSKGVLWVGSPSGLMKFDGVEWLPITASAAGLISNNVQCITVDNADNLWIGTAPDTDGNGGGLNMYNGGTTWYRHDASEGLCADDVRAVAIDADGNRWIGTSAGLSRYDLRDWTCYGPNDGLISADIASVLVDEKGQVWFGASGCITMFDGINWSTYKTSE